MRFFGSHTGEDVNVGVLDCNAMWTSVRYQPFLDNAVLYNVNLELLPGQAQMRVMILETDLSEKPAIFCELSYHVGS